MPSRKKKPAGEAAEAVEAPAAAAPKSAPKAEAKAKADPQPKAKAEAKAKADAKAAPKAKADAAPKAEAKAKADPKAKAAPKADAKASPKSQPKAEAKGKAKAESKSQPAAPKAEAKAEPKAKGKAKAKAQEAPPPPPPPVEEDDLTVVKSRRRKKKKAEEIPPDQELVPEPVTTAGPPSAEEIADQKRIRREHDKKNNALSEKFQQDLSALPAISTNKSREQVIKEVSDQKKALENIMNEINDTLKTVKIAKPKNTNVGAIMQQMRDLKLAKSGSLFTETTIKYMTEDFSMCLTQALAFDSYRAFQAEAAVIREKCQARMDANEACLKTVKSKADQNKVLKMIAEAKGVKVEDLNEKDIVSQNVDLPVEVTGLQFLYKRQFEKQYGVVIDRPEGAKGGGKGSSSPPPKGFIIRGLKKEVAECIAALKGLNLKEQKVVTGVTPKQASAIMGSQQANARKLEEEFKGVFVHREGGQGAPITLYGPAKEVAACHKSIMDNLSDEPEAPARPARPPKAEVLTMTIDKDLAKCLIGAGGVTVTKMETETSTSIKVSNHQGKDEEAQATVRITGDKANQDKAKAKITDFLYTLSSCLVEAEPEAVSRLYDGAVPRKGKGDSKGKGKGKGSGKGDGESGGNGASDSKFAELWNTSGLTCLKKAKGVQIVGTKADVAKWKVVLEECLKEAGTIPFAVRLTFEQGRLWSQERLDGVKASSEAQKVQKATRGRDTYIEVQGTDEQKEKAQAAIEEINQKLSNKDQIDDVDENTKRYLTGRGIAQLREVETKHDVCVSVDRKEKGQSVRIVGTADGVVAAKKQLKEIISGSAGITLEIDIEWDEGRVIIGKGGSTVNWIKRESGVEQVKVEETEEKKKVVLRGQKDAVEAAQKLVKEALQKDKEAAAERAAKGTNGGAEDAAEEKPKKREAAKKDVASEATEKRPSEKKWAGKAAAKQPDFQSTEASFPSLGGDDPKGKAKPRAGGVWNKGEKEEATEAVVEEKAEEKEEEKDDGN